MRDLLPDLDRWQAEGRSIALATVIHTWGSSPRRPGAKMALTLDGRIAGSVSGGCVENAVFEAGIESLKTNRSRLLHFGVADETAWEVGLACGGSVDILVGPLDPRLFAELKSVINDERPGVVATVVRGPEGLVGRASLIREDGRVLGTPVGELDARIAALAVQALSQGISRTAALNDEVEIFLEVILPPPTLILVGGVHIAIALAALANTLGYRTVVVDPREAWGNTGRFPHVDRLIQAWPEAGLQQAGLTRSTAVAVLTHDPKLDDPALRVALASPAFYVGALGSKSTQAKRRERLAQSGVAASQLARLHAPIGLDIGAQSPEEIALAIMAEVVDARRKRLSLAPEAETGFDSTHCDSKDPA